MAGMDTCDDIFSRIDKNVLQSHFHDIVDSLRITQVLDMLLERQVISVEDHDNIQKKEKRADQRSTLLTILLNKPNEFWVKGFKRVLRLTGHEDILQKIARREEDGTCTFSDIKLGSTVPWSDFLIRITTTNPSSSVININNIENLESSEESLLGNIVDIWEGSLYFLLSTATPEIMENILFGLGEENIKSFLQQLFQNNKSLLHQFGKDEQFTIELEEKDQHSFLGPEHGKKSDTAAMKTKTNQCAGCLLSTIGKNIEVVSDEIENDIIEDTFSMMTKVSAYAKEKYLASTKSRKETAMLFLKYVMADTEAILSFYEAFKLRSEIELKQYKCDECSKHSAVAVSAKFTPQIKFHFKIAFDDKENVKILLQHHSKNEKPDY